MTKDQLKINKSIFIVLLKKYGTLFMCKMYYVIVVYQALGQEGERERYCVLPGERSPRHAGEQKKSGRRAKPEGWENLWSLN